MDLIILGDTCESATSSTRVPSLLAVEEMRDASVAGVITGVLLGLVVILMAATVGLFYK